MFARSTKMTDAEKDEFKKEILDKTTLCPALKKGAKTSKLSPKAQEVMKAFESLPGDWKSNAREKALKKLFEAVLGEKLNVGSLHVTDNPRLSGTDAKRFAAIVPEEDNNGAGYPLGKVIVLVQDGYDKGMTETGGIGNHVLLEDCRFATADELDAYLDAMQKKVDINTILQYFNK